MSATRSAGREPANPPGAAPPGRQQLRVPALAPPPTAHAPPPTAHAPPPTAYAPPPEAHAPPLACSAPSAPRHFRRVGGTAPGVA